VLGALDDRDGGILEFVEHDNHQDEGANSRYEIEVGDVIAQGQDAVGCGKAFFKGLNG
jgi:hypothetical protein